MHILINADSNDLLVSGQFAIVTDPPYAVTQNHWDLFSVDVVDMAKTWGLTDCNVVLTATMAYAAQLVTDHPKEFSHDLVWCKTVGSGQLNIARRPLRKHENVLVFTIGKGPYNRLKTPGEPYVVNRRIRSKDCYGKQADNTATNTGERDATTLLEVSNPRVKGGHPTQKPLALFRELVLRYSREADWVLDPFAGSGTILDVTERTTVGVEKDKAYYGLACAKRADRLVEITPAIRDELEQRIPNIEDFEYSVFSGQNA